MSLEITERPLTGTAKAAVASGAGFTILVAYLFVLLSILFLVALLGLEVLLVLGAVRVGASRLVVPFVQCHSRLLVHFFRSLWLEKSAEFHLRLRKEEAPELQAMLQRLGRQLEIPEPDEIRVTMEVNASVRMSGFRRGSGKVVLTTGFDLLAGLAISEFEAVMAHEMAHAKLVQRGLRRWVGGGLDRIGSLAARLSAEADAWERGGRPDSLANLLAAIADWLARLTARQFAAGSRQDEFEADAKAAELTGAVIYRETLNKVAHLANVAARLPWRERVAQVHRGASFTRWLVEEFTTGWDRVAVQQSAGVFNPYATHPLLGDRLAALPVTAATKPRNATSALVLLERPDEVAEKLVQEIQRVAAEAEERDTESLGKWNLGKGGLTYFRLWQSVGVLALLGGGLFALFTLVSGSVGEGILIFILSLAAGIWLILWGRYKEKFVLPIPDYDALLAAWRNGPAWDKEKTASLEKELDAIIAKEPRKRRRAKVAGEEAIIALAQCDYQRAQVAGLRATRLDKDNIEGILAVLVSAGFFHQDDLVNWAFDALRRTTGLRGVSTNWSLAWAMISRGNWAAAEASLNRARAGRLDEPTLLALLALCQYRRGKMQSAIPNARRACSLAPGSRAQREFFLTLLLDVGHLAEAGEQLVALGEELRKDPELMLAKARFHFLSRELEKAAEWMAFFEAERNTPEDLVRIGRLYLMARQPEKAAGYYERALESEYCPEARYGLGLLAAERGQKEDAWRHFAAALNLVRPTGKHAEWAINSFSATLGQLVALEWPCPDCRAWLACFPADFPIPPLANTRLLVYATEKERAEFYLKTILTAAGPGLSAPERKVIWENVPKKHWPVGPVRPGVQRAV